MHELTIARNLIELACEHARGQGATRITRLNVRLGVLSGMLRALHFCFAPASRGTMCEGAILEIEEVPLTVHCPRCEATKAPPGRYSFRCPDCGTPTPEVLTGREMQLLSLVLESERAPSPPSRPRRRVAPGPNRPPPIQQGEP